MRITIVAVTNAFTEFCIAALTDDGKWVRPIPGAVGSRFWRRDQLLSSNGHFISAGDVFEIQGHTPLRFQYPNHTEDFVVTNWAYIGSWSNDQLMDFLDARCEGEQSFQQTVQGQGRSLCLVKVSGFTSRCEVWDERKKAKMAFSSSLFDVSNPKTKYKDYIVKDCKWERVILSEVTLPQTWNKVYLCLGLATRTTYDGIEYPQVVGLHTSPFVSKPTTYPG
jgi:hypothetical protein